MSRHHAERGLCCVQRRNQVSWRMVSHISLKAEVTEGLSGNRLDQIAAKLFPEYSRARLQSWIREGALLVNGKQLRPRDKLEEGDCLIIEAELESAETWVAQEMPLSIVYEDEHLLVPRQRPHFGERVKDPLPLLVAQVHVLEREAILLLGLVVAAIGRVGQRGEDRHAPPAGFLDPLLQLRREAGGDAGRGQACCDLVGCRGRRLVVHARRRGARRPVSGGWRLRGHLHASRAL